MRGRRRGREKERGRKKRGRRGEGEGTASGGVVESDPACATAWPQGRTTPQVGSGRTCKSAIASRPNVCVHSCHLPVEVRREGGETEGLLYIRPHPLNGLIG